MRYLKNYGNGVHLHLHYFSFLEKMGVSTGSLMILWAFLDSICYILAENWLFHAIMMCLHRFWSFIRVIKLKNKNGYIQVKHFCLFSTILCHFFMFSCLFFNPNNKYLFEFICFAYLEHISAEFKWNIWYVCMIFGNKPMKTSLFPYRKKIKMLSPTKFS